MKVHREAVVLKTLLANPSPFGWLVNEGGNLSGPRGEIFVESYSMHYAKNTSMAPRARA